MRPISKIVTENKFNDQLVDSVDKVHSNARISVRFIVRHFAYLDADLEKKRNVRALVVPETYQ